MEQPHQKPTDCHNNWNKVKEHTALKHRKISPDYNNNNEMQISNIFETLSDNVDNSNTPETF